MARGSGRQSYGFTCVCMAIASILGGGNRFDTRSVIRDVRPNLRRKRGGEEAGGPVGE